MKKRLKLAVEHHDGFIASIAARNEDAVVDLVFQHWELSRADMEMFIAPEGMKADGFVDGAAMLPMEKSL